MNLGTASNLKNYPCFDPWRLIKLKTVSTTISVGNLMNTSAIDHFKVTGAILMGVQNYWGEGKMYSECMETVGRLMLDNFRKVDYKVKIPVY